MSDILRFVAELTREDRRVVLPQAYVEWLEGDYIAAIVLNDCVWWSAQNEGRGRGGWFYRSSQDWERERWITRKQVIRAIKAINERAQAEIIQHQVRQVDGVPTAHFRVDPEAFRSLLHEAILPKGQNGRRYCPKGNIQESAQRAISTSKELNRVKDIADPERIGGSPEDRSGEMPAPKAKPQRPKYDIGRHKDQVYRDPEFIRLWERYPRRDAKQDAAKAWYGLHPSPDLISSIHAALDWQIPRWQATDAAIPYASTYLNHHRWEDERPNAHQGLQNGPGSTEGEIYGYDAIAALNPRLRANNGLHESAGSFLSPEDIAAIDRGKDPR